MEQDRDGERRPMNIFFTVTLQKCIRVRYTNGMNQSNPVFLRATIVHGM